MSRCKETELIDYTTWREYCSPDEYVKIKDIIHKADIVPVVRCASCRFYDPEWKFCNHQRTGRAPDYYCASGRVKE